VVLAAHRAFVIVIGLGAASLALGWIKPKRPL
jgi:hypothetical protein